MNEMESYVASLYVFYCYGFNQNKNQINEIIEKLDEEYLKLSNKKFVEYYIEEQGFDSFEEVKSMCNFIKDLKQKEKRSDEYIQKQFENIQPCVINSLLEAYKYEFKNK